MTPLMSASAVRAAGARSLTPSVSSLTSLDPTADVRSSDAEIELDATSDWPTARERISDLPTELVRRWLLLTLLADRVAAA